MIVNKYKYGGGGSGSGSTYTAGEYIQIAEDVISVTGITPDLYLTTADTQDFITSAYTGFTKTEDFNELVENLEGKEEVIASALTQLENSILEISGDTPDLSNYYTKAETDAEITGATQDLATEAYVTAATQGLATEAYVTAATQGFITSAYTGFTKTEDFDELVESLEGKEEAVAAALVDLDERVEERVESQDVKHIVKLTQSAYDALATKDPNTFYIIVENQGE